MPHLRRAVPFALLVLLAAAAVAGEDWRATAWYREADQRIDRHRRGDLRLRLVDDRGRPIAGTGASIALRRHRFRFGTCINATVLGDGDDAERYRAAALRLGGAVVFENEMKWYAQERQAGAEDFAAADAMLAWCRAQSLEVRGHCLFWDRAKFVERQPWLAALTGDALRAAVERRIDGAVGRYAGRLIAWDVNNEMLDGGWYGQRLPGIAAEMFRRAHGRDPATPLFLNEFAILGETGRTGRYLELIAGLRADGAPVGGIGIQEHACERFATARGAVAEDDGFAERSRHATLDPEAAWASLDRLAATGLPIHLTEVSAKARDPQARAIALETLYRVAFAHPGVDAVLLWGFWARSHWLGADAALYDRDWRPTAAGAAIERLLHEEWTTRVEAVSDADGWIAFRGFYGTYAVDADGIQAVAAFAPDQREAVAVLAPAP